MYSRFVAITNRHLCSSDFLTQIEGISRLGLKAIVLREKDLPESEYQTLAEQVLTICRRNETDCILHTHIQVARALNCNRIHLSLPLFMKHQHSLQEFCQVGVSCHSIEDALLAQEFGARYITASHIFQTNCKPGLPPRGLEFLWEVCQSVSIPVYALGGISFDNAALTLACGAEAACMMSGFMQMQVL